MLGKVIGIDEANVYVKLEADISKIENLVGFFVILKDSDDTMIGEISNVKDNIACIHLMGQFFDGKFSAGILKKPAFSSSVTLASDEVVESIVGIKKYRENEHLYIGNSAVYPNIQVGVNVNSLFSGHFAIFGSTGSGKSCSVARIFQNLFMRKKSIPYRASMFIFDAYGEYHNAFSKIHESVPEINFKVYTTNLNEPDGEILRIPLWLLSVDDIALILGAEKHSQLPIIEKALKFVSIFARKEEEVIKSKNDIIARALLDILSSGRSSSQIRDQIVSVLSYYNTKELNLETPIYQPGYTRPLKQCLLIDNTGKIREMELVVNFLETFLIDGHELNLPDGSFAYNLKDLKDALDFALISEGILKSEKIFDEANVLKVRLHSLLNSSTSIFFEYPEYITEKNYIKELMTAKNGKKAQIINFNINYIDDRMAKTITKIYSKMLFEFAKNLEQRSTIPFHIILEEAHRYVQNDNDKYLLGYNIFERITKEGRKYGVILGLISQRPYELSETALSQCSNFLIFKMLHHNDIAYIREMVPNITEGMVKKIKILQPGTCMAFGSAFKIPCLIRLEMPNPAPSSSSCDISNIWFIDKN